MGSEKNKDYAQNNQLFIEACRLAVITPTRRQASKFRQGRGAAYRLINQARVSLREKGGKA